MGYQGNSAEPLSLKIYPAKFRTVHATGFIEVKAKTGFVSLRMPERPHLPTKTGFGQVFSLSCGAFVSIRLRRRALEAIKGVGSSEHVRTRLGRFRVDHPTCAVKDLRRFHGQWVAAHSKSTVKNQKRVLFYDARSSHSRDSSRHGRTAAPTTTPLRLCTSSSAGFPTPS